MRLCIISCFLPLLACSPLAGDGSGKVDCGSYAMDSELGQDALHCLDLDDDLAPDDPIESVAAVDANAAVHDGQGSGLPA